jgi:hypothetical protein
MKEQQITDRLIAAHSAYVEKTGKQPNMRPMLSFSAGGKILVWMHGDKYGDEIGGKGTTFAAALDALDAEIAAIPSAEEQARNEAAKAVANAIEKCRAAGYDGEVLNPLADLAKRISENALTYQPATETEGAPV